MDIVPKENGSINEKTAVTEPSKEKTDVPSPVKPLPAPPPSDTPKITENTTKSNGDSTEIPAPAEVKKDVEVKVKEPEEVTKRSIRVGIWKYFLEKKQAQSSLIFNRIPNFINNEEASKMFAETDEFKKAERIKVNVDYPQDSVKFKVVSANKKLYLTSAKESKALYTLVDCPADAELTKQKEIIKSYTKSVAGSDEPITDIYNQEKLDIIVIGSVAVSRDGYRIGKGNGYVDLEFGILVHCGVITENTLIVTTVHDCQVRDTLPKELFTCYDVPVDMIVTPTEVIRVSKKLTRPTGIYWNILSERRLGVVPILKQIKLDEEENGKVIVLKSEDTDVESYRNRSKARPRRRVHRFASKKSTTDSGSNENARRRRPMNADQLQQKDKNTDNGSQQKPVRQGNGRNDRDRRTGGRQGRYGDSRRRPRRTFDKDFCIKISNISRGVRVTDLKQELRTRGCNPMYISWKAHYGKCYLHFGKRGADDSDAIITETMDLLNNLSLNIKKGDATEEVQLNVELVVEQTGENRIETVEVSTV